MSILSFLLSLFFSAVLTDLLAVSLGKPSSAALEKLCADTEALLDETARKTGSSAAFVNTRWEFLGEREGVS